MGICIYQKIVNSLRCSRNTIQKYQGYLNATWQYVEIEPYIAVQVGKWLSQSLSDYIQNSFSLLFSRHF